jgi:predicted nucleic acid-binding protein
MLAVDTSVLLSIFKNEGKGAAWLDLLRAAAQRESVGICSVVLAEIRSFFPDDIACMAAVEAVGLEIWDVDAVSALLAGTIFQKYRKQGGPRSVILPDFVIAAHAAAYGAKFATVDRGYFRSYFPALTIMEP